MNNQRRRANDFTDSLNSFRQVNDEENSIFESISQDSLDTDSIRNRQCRDHNRAKNDASQADSIILAAETATKSNQEKDDTSFYDAFLLPKTSVLQNQKEFYSTEKCQKLDSSSERSSKEELNPTELRKFLQSLDQKSIREEPVQERLRRMSTNYNDSPKNFTERLLTIIEESFAIDSQANVSLCRLIEEFQKCNFIEDETAPEWIHSSPSMSISIRVRKGSQEFKNDLLRKSVGATPNKDLYLSTPPRFNINSPNKAYRRTPKNIAHNIRSPQLDNTSTFESLEAYCEKLYPNEFKALAAREKNQCQSPLKNMNRILRACENQMASLENSPNVHEQLKQARRSTSDSISQRNTVPEALCRLLSYEQCDKTDSQSVPDILKQRTEHNKRYERIKPDNLRNSLIHEIAKKRQKCIDTVKTMEMEADSESMEAQKICPTTNNNKPVNPSIVNDAKFMETLKCVKKYQDYLEQNKPLLSFLQRSESYNSPHDKKNTKKIPNENFNTDITTVPSKTTLRVPKSSTTRNKCISPSLLKPHFSNKVTGSKPKLFYTPGKTTVQTTIKNSRPKCTYFPNKLDATSKQKENHVSPHEKSIYRQIGTYDYIKSPIASYIRGTDPYLVKNLRPKTDENLLTPRKKQANQSSSSKPNLKFRLSPKEKSTQTPVRENIANNFSYPKVNYKLPSHVRTIKEGENLKVGNRVNQLLRSTQDKVVIRHEGRPKSAQTDYLEQSEIHYDSAEDSVHVEQTARKTCFSRAQKNY
ncbi:uncharacterized protein [Linepithema humile]|uniref:uncharacterized protein isoform X2 n=1 Tax=Linepithema humile TaxID=83485 RepID=UPI0006232E1C|nr:PREDICTED: uncharacterized protein LOC105675260 isoform X2 [Linepithema humile]